MEHLLNSSYSREDWIKFLKNKFLPEDFELSREEVKLDFSSNYIDPKAFWIGDCESLGNLAVIEVQHESENDPRVGVSRDAFRLMAEHQINKALFFFVSKKTNNFRFSLITLELKLVGKNIKPVFSNPHRYSFFLGEEAKIHTPQEFLFEKGRIVNFDDLKDRFSIEVVNKEFYYGIQRLFYKLVGGEVKQGSQKYEFTPIIKLPFTQNHKTLQEFAVRLVGRLVFCWFLKKKKSDDNQLPLIPEELLSSGAVEDNYYHNVLEPLFFQILNTKIEDRLPKFRSQLYDSIPFLNGGLFDPKLHQDFYEADEMGNSKYINTLKIPDSWLQEFLELLEIYNFTIDENTSIDIDLSVDPEMLGRIFENLLAEINPETGKTARKSTGSYYTPRPIVEYMVDESLIQYLLTKLTPKFPETNQTPTGHCEESSAAELPKQSKLEKQIRELLDYNIEGTELPKEQKIAVIDALDKLKVLDPACGSGAFPMGVLQKMVLILDKVDPESIEWVMKQLERIPDPMVREAMEEKLMHENWKWRHKMGIIRNSIYGVDIQPIATEISKLRLFLTIIVDEKIEDDKENRNINALPNLSFKFVTANTLIGLPESEEQMSLFDDTLDELMQKLEDLRSKFFYKAGKEKAQIEAEFIETQQQIGQYLCQDGSENKRAIALANWKPFSDEASSWFDPTWMFGIKGGFDIVIGNPPYVDSETMKKKMPILRNTIRSLYSTANGNWDYYIPFMEKSIMLSKNNQICLIVPNKWLVLPYGNSLRELIINYLYSIVDLSKISVFEAGNTPIIVSTSQNTKDYIKVVSALEDRFILTKIRRKIINTKNFGLLLSSNIELVSQINNCEAIIGDLLSIENPFSTSEAYKLKEVIFDGEKPKSKKLLVTGTITKFSNLWGKKQTPYLKNKYLFPVVEDDDLVTSFAKRYNKQINRPKIISKGIRYFDNFLDLDGNYIAGKSTLISLQKDDNLKILKIFLGLYNSKLCYFLLKEMYSSSGIGGGINFATWMIENLPVPNIYLLLKSGINNLVDRILSNVELYKWKKNIIDLMVYKLYELTYEEAKIVDPQLDSVLSEFGLSKEDYEKMSVEELGNLR